MEKIYYKYPNPVDNANAGIEIRKQDELLENETYLLHQAGLDTYASLEAWTALGTNKQINYSTHGIFRYFGKFPSTIAAHLIMQYTHEKGRVMDPMAGSGTTAVECLLSNRNCVCCDINPLSVLLEKVKVTKLDADILQKTLNEISHEYRPLTLEEFEWKPIGIKNIDHWFLLETQNSIRGLIYLINKIEDYNIRDFFLICLASSIRTVSRATTQQGRLFLDVDTAKKDCLETFITKAKKAIPMVSSLPKNNNIDIDILNHSVTEPFNIDNTNDLIILHPPYFNSYKYSSVNSLELAWLREDHASVRKNEIHEFFKVGKAENISRYVQDMVSSLENVSRTMTPGGTLALMIGDTIIKGQYIQTTKLVVDEFLKRKADISVEKVIIRVPKYTEASWSTSQRRTTEKVGINLNDFIIIFKRNDESTSDKKKNVSTFDIDFIKAETHTPEYLMHKYWARKPHNVINECIKKLTKKGDIVIDPFCGSGVTLREASLLSRQSYGFDLNPVAILISKVLVNPPKVNEFIDTFNSIYDKAYKKFGYLYKTEDGRVIKYVSHRIVSKCSCGKIVKKEECISNGKKLICPHCGKKIGFNLENLQSTDIFNIIVENDKFYIPSDSELSRQMEFSEFEDFTVNSAKYKHRFPENRRILAFNGIGVEDFFTKRNFTIISFFANEIWNIKDEKIRDCALLLLTSSVAQCSRLIANRNNLSTGGPAWSIPGFWVPTEHLEANPFIHFKVRMNKYAKALNTLEINKGNVEPIIVKGDSLNILQNGKYKDLKADLIFLDPPYGDSVPYTEFSCIWNSFLDDFPNFNDDISVTDRIEKSQSWELYGKKLEAFMSCFTSHLNPEGKLLITFNNNDMKAWYSLISALQKNHFVCRNVFYQIPAVISSKARKSPKTSYISDVYSVYTHDPSNIATRDLSPLLSHLCFIANSRDGKVGKIVLDREFIIAWLKNNLDCDLLREKEQIISSMFTFDTSKNLYTLKDEYKRKTERLNDAAIESLDELAKKGDFSFLDGYLYVSSKCQRFGTMEMYEFKDFLDHYERDKNNNSGFEQLELFEPK